MFNHKKERKLIEPIHLIPESDCTLEVLPRPCTVRGEKAYFHRWADKTEIVIQDRTVFLTRMTDKAVEEALKRVREGYIPPEFDSYTRRETVAIIEYEDGTVAEVAPRDIRFTESCYNGILTINNHS